MCKKMLGIFSYRFVFILIILHLALYGISCAFTAGEVLVVVNKRMSGAGDLAAHYMKVRNIPQENLLQTALTLDEVMTREDYDKRLKKPVRAAIAKRKEAGTNIQAIVLIYGIPLKVAPPELDWRTEDQVRDLRRKQQQIRTSSKDGGSAEQLIKDLGEQVSLLLRTDSRASVDSELMLVKAEKYELSGWIENPYFLGFQNSKSALSKNEVLLVARLDALDERTVHRLIDDSVAAERKGLKGKAYFDARWELSEHAKTNAYDQWDASLHRAASVVQRRMPVILDTTKDLFPAGSAPDAALYAGWYSLGTYIDSFTWVQGAVGYHIASAECRTLKKAESKVWCVQLLQRGAVATIGPVYEPYVQAFPLPEIFFAAFTEGYMDLGESYLISLPYISWQMVLVGDPLYRPFQPLPLKGGLVPHQ